MQKKNSNTGGIVYSTNPDFKIAKAGVPAQNAILPAQQKLQIRLDKKHRAGKAVTLVNGFAGKDDELEELGKSLKTYCGTGGSVKDNQVIIQGDQRDKVLQWLIKNGYNQAKKM